MAENLKPTSLTGPNGERLEFIGKGVPRKGDWYMPTWGEYKPVKATGDWGAGVERELLREVPKAVPAQLEHSLEREAELQARFLRNLATAGIGKERESMEHTAKQVPHEEQISRLCERAEKAESLAAQEKERADTLYRESDQNAQAALALIEKLQAAESERDRARAERDDARTVLFTVNALNVVIKAERDALEASLETARTALTAIDSIIAEGSTGPNGPFAMTSRILNRIELALASLTSETPPPCICRGAEYPHEPLTMFVGPGNLMCEKLSERKGKERKCKS